MHLFYRLLLCFCLFFLPAVLGAQDFPTAFSPNGDGKNDIFAKGYSIKIKNRHGYLLFSGNDGWRGETKHQWTADAGVYFYEITLPSGETKKGTVELFRERGR